MKKNEIICGLSYIKHMTDDEIAYNAQFIRNIATACCGLFSEMKKIAVQNDKMRKTIQHQIGRIANLEYRAEKEKAHE